MTTRRSWLALVLSCTACSSGVVAPSAASSDASPSNPKTDAGVAIEMDAGMTTNDDDASPSVDAAMAPPVDAGHPDAASGAQPVDSDPPVQGSWKTIFEDDFQTDTSVGDEYLYQLYWGNGGLPAQGVALETADNASNVILASLGLRLVAKKGNGTWTSGLVQTDPGFQFTYGYIESRINLPGDKGWWPTFWMLPSNHQDGPGEIDIMDNGASGGPLVMHGACKGNQAGGDTGTAGPTLTAGWHTIGLDWEYDHISWYADGNAWFTVTDASVIPNYAEYFILDLQVGSDWGANAGKETSEVPTATSGEMDVAWVKVWQKM